MGSSHLDFGKISDLISNDKSGKSPEVVPRHRKKGSTRKRKFLMESIALNSEDETESENVDLESFDEFDFMKIFKIPIILFFLTSISLVFVGAFGKEYTHAGESMESIYKLDLNYRSFIWNISEKIRIEDLQTAIHLLLRHVDVNFNRTDSRLEELEGRLNNSLTENAKNHKDQESQIDNFERKISSKLDHLEKMVQELELKIQQ
ncbi:putative integral membrane protein [Cryptosporidium felis]|nr:putative integral membrane protein [Cryptosporidium felis]